MSGSFCLVYMGPLGACPRGVGAETPQGFGCWPGSIASLLTWQCPLDVPCFTGSGGHLCACPPPGPCVVPCVRQGCGPGGPPSCSVFTMLLRPPDTALPLWAPRQDHVKRLPGQLGGKKWDVEVTLGRSFLHVMDSMHLVTQCGENIPEKREIRKKGHLHLTIYTNLPKLKKNKVRTLLVGQGASA